MLTHTHTRQALPFTNVAAWKGTPAPSILKAPPKNTQKTLKAKALLIKRK